MKDYLDFLQKKSVKTLEIGFTPKNLNKNLFDFQKHIVLNALKKGRYAVFADCGLGKTLMQLEIANQCQIHNNKKSLILAPLAVTEQTIDEGLKFGIDVGYVGSKSEIHITNYEQIANIEPDNYGCICLDESSILKNFQGKTKKLILETFINTPYRFAFTATPSPNDTMEMGNHSEYLGQMKFKNMLSMYFINDMDTVQKWRIKGHAEQPFWMWVASWAVCLTKPEDLGYCHDGYHLPNLNIINHRLETEKLNNGLLFNDLAVSSTNHNQELKRTFDLRMKTTIDIANATNDSVIVWCKHNEESEYLTKHINGAVEVSGSMSDEIKKNRLLGFARDEFRVLVTKTKIAQYGLNYQNCHIQIFPSLDFSFESTYQAIRRSYRFGQKEQVDIHLITTDTMTNVIESIERKQEQFKEMQLKLSKYAS